MDNPTPTTPAVANAPATLDVNAIVNTVISSYLSKVDINTVNVGAEVGRLARDTLRGLQEAQAPEEVALTPAVPIEDSIQDDYIVCLEDGKRLKMLKRYLRTHFDLSPEEYRAKWGLPADYPIVAPNYSKRRSEFAKDIGLGKGSTGRPRKATEKAAPGKPDSDGSEKGLTADPSLVAIEGNTSDAPTTFNGHPLPENLVGVVRVVEDLIVEGEGIYNLETGEMTTILDLELQGDGMEWEAYLTKWDLPEDFPRNMAS